MFIIMTPPTTTKRFMIYPKFLSQQTQLELIQEVFARHASNSTTGTATNIHTTGSTSTVSQTMSLGISCGASLDTILPLAVQQSRLLFSRAALESSHSHQPSSERILVHLASNNTTLTGIALLYGPNAIMLPHYDAPTQHGQKEEWLCMMTMGSNVDFILDDAVITMKAGDCLVMDSMSTKHGVQRIWSDDDDNVPLVLPIQGSRLGILLWEGKNNTDNTTVTTGTKSQPEAQVDGIDLLFGDE